MKILLLVSFLSLSSLCNAQQIATPSFVPTWQPKFNLYQTDTITNIKTTLQSKKYEAVKVGYKSTVVGSDLKNSVDHDLNFNVGTKFLSGTLSASLIRRIVSLYLTIPHPQTLHHNRPIPQFLVKVLCIHMQLYQHKLLL